MEPQCHVDAHSSLSQWTTSSLKWELHYILFIYFSAFSAKHRHIMVSHACLWIKNIVPLQGMLCFGHAWNQTLVRPFPSLRLYRRLCIFVKVRSKQARHDKGKAQINMSCQSVEKAWERQGTNKPAKRILFTVSGNYKWNHHSPYSALVSLHILFTLNPKVLLGGRKTIQFLSMQNKADSTCKMRRTPHT